MSWKKSAVCVVFGIIGCILVVAGCEVCEQEKEEIASLEQALQVLGEERSSLQADVNEVTAALDETKEELAEIRQARRKLQEQLIVANKHLEQLAAQKNEAIQDTKRTREAVGKLEGELSERSEQLEEKEHRLNELEKQIGKLLATIREVREKLEQI